MKASELRIGNYVFKDGEIFSIQILHISHTNIGIEPIPLTEEWLLRFGFKDNRIMLPGDGELEIRLKGNTFHIWPADGQTESHNYRNHIYYVHQIQNLVFALTGEELTIKEPAV
jgi:hypothetical protein